MPRSLRALALAIVAAVAAVGMPCRTASAQCNDPAAACELAGKSIWLGDMNNDGLVDALDVSIWTSCILENLSPTGTPVYCQNGDLNFDGEIDTDDLNYLNQLVAMASTAGTGKLPRVTLSEIRVRKPNTQTDPLVPQGRYVEIRLPTAAVNVPSAPTVNGTSPGDPGSIRRLTAGWYYLKVCRSNNGAGTDQVSGTVAVVQDLNGMPWISNPLDTQSRGLAVVADASFTGTLAAEVPPAASPFVFPAAGSLKVPDTAAGRVFASESATNVTHLIVFRRPDPGNARAVPTVGQRVNVPSTVDITQVCHLPWTVPVASVGTLPPWDAIVDAVTIVRGTDQSIYGCIFADHPNPASSIGPVGSVSDSFAPPHVYRCRNAGSLTKGPNAIAAGSDTPFARNPLCTTNVTTCGELGPGGAFISCFEPHSGTSCSDADCCNAVCAIDPTCCNVTWDQSCADQARVTCVTCGQSTASCYVEHATPSCSDPACCERVCAVDPECCEVSWDSACAATAADLCLACGVLETGACNQVHDLPYCSDAECCNQVCQINPFCCATGWDQACVDTAATACASCGSLGSGPCCIAHATPYCSNAQCCAAVCATDPFCCTSAWDVSCTQVALITPACGEEGCVCGGAVPPGAEGSCFVAHVQGGCADAFCCQTVCIHDPFCCFVTWDTACVAIANDLCSTVAGCIDPVTSLPVNGSCFVAHVSPGCDKPGCCSQVCAEPSLAYCCQVLWDEACAIRAAEVCDACGDPLAGSCFQAHAAPNCADPECCSAVCAVDPFCCEGTWDQVCVGTASTNCANPTTVCGDPSTVRSCWIPSYTPGCSDPACCTAICQNIDPYCCEARWDAVCAREASFICTPDFTVTIGREGCLQSHASPGCANADCSRAVCSVDPSCCTVEWDQGCVLVAVAVCPAPESCPGTGDCFSQHSSPGCRDSACCNGVCNADPSCCQGEWDAACVSLARQLCQVPPGQDWVCPCQGDCFAQHDGPGCNDGSCCSIVCNFNPACCDASWDGACVSLAREYCCGAPGCGSGCNKPCLVVHQEPFCADPYCCDAVCRTDPLCCSASWDALCVNSALERCGSACGLEEAGDCFVQHDLAGCRNGNCCAAVCEVDPACCTVAWDQPCADRARDPKLSSACVMPVCGDPLAGPSCQPHPGQASSDLACCEAVCEQDSYCCDTEWDATCVDLARTVPSCGCTYECGDTCAGSCCRAHDNGACDDPDCCAVVCAQDSYCCDVIWDSVCASTARSLCSGKDDACPLPPCGSDLLPSCCVVSAVPHCNNESCCNQVCAIDPFCCDVQWDLTCVNRAIEIPGCGCDGPNCGDPDAGSCFQVHSDPFCDEAGCCQTVCAFDPTCCDTAWDADCVSVAKFFCGGGFAPLLDAYRGGPLREVRGRAHPPAGWIPPRERAALRVPRPLPEGVKPLPRPQRADEPAMRSDGIQVKPGKGAPAAAGEMPVAKPAAPAPGKK